MKEIIPTKKIITLDDEGEFKNAVVQYRVREDGKLGRDFKTISVSEGVGLEKITQVITDSLDHVHRGEKIERIAKEEKQK